jgi:hypothetical protein
MPLDDSSVVFTAQRYTGVGSVEALGDRLDNRSLSDSRGTMEQEYLGLELSLQLTDCYEL